MSQNTISRGPSCLCGYACGCLRGSGSHRLARQLHRRQLSGRILVFWMGTHDGEPGVVQTSLRKTSVASCLHPYKNLVVIHIAAGNRQTVLWKRWPTETSLAYSDAVSKLVFSICSRSQTNRHVWASIRAVLSLKPSVRSSVRERRVSAAQCSARDMLDIHREVL